MNKYRSHNCNELRKEDLDKKISLSGWINKKRDHGNLLFIDLRDHYGITQCVIDKENKFFKELEKLQLETVIKINGKVVERTKETINKDLNKPKWTLAKDDVSPQDIFRLQEGSSSDRKTVAVLYSGLCSL